MKERPILFSGPMVRTILSGQKTVTRRPTSPKLVSAFDAPRGQGDVEAGYPFVECRDGYQPAVEFCPYGRVGDRLWVRETHKIATGKAGDSQACVRYEADGEYQAKVLPMPESIGPRTFDRTRPSIHMPRWASRILLEVTDVRVERLRDSDDIALLDELGDMLEDCDSVAGREFSRIESLQVAGAPLKMLPEMYGFKAWWDKTNGGGSFDANPWVWVVEFKRIEP
ncbi:hypothetical protein QU926_18305 [Pseudomonas asiatica]|uniref:hypothetical protein n=1 Tax=Pseudomonas asiatica TaxID=2219225 RepID=UPI0025AB28F1|nr:hypothetical protein [Pseudomonas asiatica]MDM9555577.1 hypothetical protein [Pseudomonas asiatica]